MTASGVRLENVAVILCRPALSENIGTAARAAANMGLGRLIVVEPGELDLNIIRGAATRSGETLVTEMTLSRSLPEALAEFHYVVGTTARRGAHRGPFLTPRQSAEKLISLSRNNKIALVFGPERTGLTTAELRLCHDVVRIPTVDNRVSSLNLAQAVLILGYELLLAWLEEPLPPQVQLADQAELQAMYEHLAGAMLRIKFLPDQNTEHWLMSFKRIFNRTGLTRGECNLIRGVCRQIEWALANPDKLEFRVE